MNTPGATRRSFFKQSAAAATGLALARALGATPANAGETGSAPSGSATDMLGDRAKECLRQVQDVSRGPGGLIISHSRFDTRRPLQAEAQLPPYLSQVLDSVWGPEAPKPTVSDWYYGENTAWASGWLLWSQMIRYRVTKEAEALEVARKCFEDLSHIFDLSRTIEPGLLGKPHGGRPGRTTSYDQSANPILPYCNFAKTLGTPAEKEQARSNMLQHGDYYLNRNWVMNHHGNFVRVVDPAGTSTMKYLACIHEAYVMTGAERFRDAAEKYVRQVIAEGQIPWPAKRYEINANVFYYSWLGEYWNRTRLAKDADWIGNIGIYWEGAKHAMDADGLIRDGVYDTVAKTFTPVTEGWFETSPPSAGKKRTPLRWWRSPTGYQGRVLYSLVTAILGLMAQKHGLDPKGAEISKKILTRISPDCFRQCWDDGRLPEEMKPFANLFPAEYCGQWLIGYWMGREQGVW